MSNTLNISVGYDPREACVYHTFCQSVIEHASGPVSFIPLHEPMLDFDGQQDGSNAFIYSRYLVPYLQDYQGWALFFDGDGHVNTDVYELLQLADSRFALQVVKHDYKTCQHQKYIGTPIESPNYDYPRKNWSSVILYNNSHPSNKVLDKALVAEAGGAFLHRLQWLSDDEIGDLPKEWNHLVIEQEPNPNAKLVHHTLGSPGFEHYSKCETSREWNTYLLNALHMKGERQAEMVRRAHWHNGNHNRLCNTADGNS